MTLNRQTLIPNKADKAGRKYAEVVLLGDVHFGSDYCNVQKFKEMVKYCTQNELYVFCMGDMIEAATRYSIGSGVYEQKHPQNQVEDLVDILRPLSESGLIVGYLTGNHEDRITKATGIDISKSISKELKVTYLGAAGWSLFYVGKQSYTLYAIHGSSSSKHKYTKIKAVLDVASTFPADIVAMGHVHDLDITSGERQYVDRKRKTVYNRRFITLITGHYLNYDGYAKGMGLEIGKQGSPKVKLFAEEWDVHPSI